MAHPIANKYIPGEYIIKCDYCQLGWYSADMTKTWDGHMACPRDQGYIEKHVALEPVKPRADELSPIPDARPEPEDRFVSSPTANKVALGIPDF